MMIPADCCIVTVRNIFDSPCLYKYEAIMDAPFDIIYWDRTGNDETCKANNHYRFFGMVKSSNSKIFKLLLYVKFARYAAKIIRKNKYDKLIVYPTQTAWCIRKVLNLYKGKYLLDIRDYAGENNMLINKLTTEAVKNSALCSITSPAYKKFLPQNHKYIISHNTQAIDKSIINAYREKDRQNKDTIIISFIGSVRFIPQLEKVISVFGNDDRFELRFIGNGSEQLRDFCKKGNFLNVSLIGKFEKKDIGKHYLDTDIALNLYGNNNPFLDYALSNKLYSAALMGMPILCSPNTYMAEIAVNYGFGLAVDLEKDNCTDIVFDFYKSINFVRLYEGCDAFISIVNEQDKEYSRRVRSFLNNER